MKRQKGTENRAMIVSQAALPRKLVVAAARETFELFMDRGVTEQAHLPMTSAVAVAIEKHPMTLPITGEARD